MLTIARHRLAGIVRRSPFLQALLYPAILLRRKLRNRPHENRRRVLASVIPHFAEDPVLAVPEFEGNFQVDVRSHLFARLVLNGCYEPELAQACLAHLDPERDAVDVGANVGFYSVLIGKHLSHGRRVLAIEPTANALRKLQKNIDRNDVRSKVVVYEGVVAQESGQLTINTIAGKEEYSSVGPIEHPSVRGQLTSSYIVEASKLDTLVETFGLNPGFVKIDVEGAEHQVFAGATNTLLKHRPVILSELTDSLLRKNGSSSDRVIAFLATLGYDVVNPLGGAQGVAGTGDFETILCLPRSRR